MCIPIPLFFWILTLVLVLGWLLGAICFNKTIAQLKHEIKENEDHRAFLLVQNEMNEELLKRAKLPITAAYKTN